MRIFSIDTGLSGAWAMIVDGRVQSCGDMPVAGEGTKRRVASTVLAELLKAQTPDLCVIEYSSARPGEAPAYAFKFGVSFGTAITVPAVLQIPFELVVPVVWKRHFTLLGTDKEASRQKALQLVPWMAGRLDRKGDHNRAEAILIGLFGEATWGAGRAAA